MRKLDEDLIIQKDVIRNETVDEANTELRVGNMFGEIIDSKVNKSRLGITNISEDFLDPNGPDNLPVFTYRIDGDGNLDMFDEFGCNGLFKLFRPGSGEADTSLYSRFPIQLGAGRSVAVEFRVRVTQLVDVGGSGNGDVWIGLLNELDLVANGDIAHAYVGYSVFHEDWTQTTHGGSITDTVPSLAVDNENWITLRMEINEDFTELVYYFNGAKYKVTGMSSPPKSTSGSYLELRPGVKCSASGSGTYEIDIDYILIQIF